MHKTYFSTQNNDNFTQTKHFWWFFSALFLLLLEWEKRIKLKRDFFVSSSSFIVVLCGMRLEWKFHRRLYVFQFSFDLCSTKKLFFLYNDKDRMMDFSSIHVFNIEMFSTGNKATEAVYIWAKKTQFFFIFFLFDFHYGNFFTIQAFYAFENMTKRTLFFMWKTKCWLVFYNSQGRKNNSCKAIISRGKKKKI